MINRKQLFDSIRDFETKDYVSNDHVFTVFFENDDPIETSYLIVSKYKDSEYYLQVIRIIVPIPGFDAEMGTWKATYKITDVSHKYINDYEPLSLVSITNDIKNKIRLFTK